MTCVVASPWNPFSTTATWSPMNSQPPDSLHPALERSQSHGYASSGSEQPKKSGTSKKRASRAGTRSVSTLSAAQLERKRANDREAQRAIRQRTKDHIDSLENTISELRRSQDANEKVNVATRQRNRELEEENAYMRMKLGEAGLTIDVPPPSSRPQDPALLAAHGSSPAAQVSGASIQRPASTSTSRSFSGTHPGPSGSWQHQQHVPRGSYSGLSNLPLAVPGAAGAPAPANLTTWRSHESTQSMPSMPGEIQTPARNASSLPYNTPAVAERPQWPSNTPQYQYTVTTEQQSQQQYHTHAQQHSPYGPAPMQSYPPAQHAAQHQPAYHPPQIPPQTEFQNLSVSGSPAAYTVAAPGTQSFVPPQQYHVAPMSSTEYQQPQAPLPSQPITAPSYQHSASEQTFPGAPQQQSSVHYRDDSGRGYSLGHYPSA